MGGGEEGDPADRPRVRERGLGHSLYCYVQGNTCGCQMRPQSNFVTTEHPAVQTRDGHGRQNTPPQLAAVHWSHPGRRDGDPDRVDAHQSEEGVAERIPDVP